MWGRRSRRDCNEKNYTKNAEPQREEDAETNKLKKE